MIHRMILSNFYSFRDQVTIDLTVPETVADVPGRLVAPTEGSVKRYPKVIGLYGPNGSGKSTVLRAISFLSQFIGHSFSWPTGRALPCTRFASQRSKALPMFFEIEFDAPGNRPASAERRSVCTYIYRLTLNGGEGQPKHVEHEQLFHFPSNATRRVTLFERDANGMQSGAKAFGLQGFMKSLKKVLRSDASVISTLAQLGHDWSEKIQDAITDVSFNIFLQLMPFNEGTIAERYFEDKNLLLSLNRCIAQLDLGVAEVAVNKPANDRSYPDVQYQHKGIEQPFHISNESQGTRHFFRIFPIIFDALDKGGIAVIDELDSSIHTLLLPEIIRWFWDEKRNPLNAQLWFTCQNPYLLQELTKEEILFTEKDEMGGSTVFGLNDIKFVRRDDNYMKKYLGGAYGALPHLG